MFMRITRGQWADASMLDSEAANEVLQALFTTVRSLPGNQCYMGGVDAASRGAVAVSVWDTEEHARHASEGVADIAGRLRALGLRIDPTEFYEVTTPVG